MNEGNSSMPLLYADGTNPRYDGTASAHVSSLGGRYYFTYDNHDRLTTAAYSSSTRGENYSTEYSYNSIGAPTSLKRKGHNVAISTLGGGYGVLDDLTYSWDGAQLQSVTEQANGGRVTLHSMPPDSGLWTALEASPTSTTTVRVYLHKSPLKMVQLLTSGRRFGIGLSMWQKGTWAMAVAVVLAGFEDFHPTTLTVELEAVSSGFVFEI